MNKEQILKAISKIKKAQNLLKQVDKEIATCNYVSSWHIYGIDLFKSVCETLKIGYKTCKDKESGYTHFEAHYNDLKICACGRVDDE